MTQRVLKSINYIEAHLGDDFQSSETSDAACYSYYHFLRIFHALTGMTVSAYIRRRRLTKAAEALSQDQNRIIEIAQNAGFESQAAFSRAFKDMFGETPGCFRAQKGNPYAKGQSAITEKYLQHIRTGSITMKPRFERKEAFTVIGLGKDYNLANPNTIGALWNAFLAQKNRIEQTRGEDCYGICYAPKEKEAMPDKFHYTAALRVNENAPVPEGMEKIHIAAQEYAVFTHKGPTSNITITNDFIWKTWLPQSGVDLADAPDFELYGAKWKDNAPDSEFEIFVPIIR
ncbi:MAG: AraC family transcriptional regulator [Alphaproteobacteria bacterium]|nr:AraC family transcriptional regulator [Alphaproteobacteria bacterium]